MRTTLDLPDDLHRLLKSLASHSERSLGQTAADLIRRGLEASTQDFGATAIEFDHKIGLPRVHLSRIITPDHVKDLDDDV